MHCSYWFSVEPIVKTKAKDINNNLMKTATVLNSMVAFFFFCMCNSRRNEFLMKINIKSSARINGQKVEYGNQLNLSEAKEYHENDETFHFASIAWFINVSFSILSSPTYNLCCIIWYARSLSLSSVWLQHSFDSFAGSETVSVCVRVCLHWFNVAIR